MKLTAFILALTAFSVTHGVSAEAEAIEPIALWFQGFGWQRLGPLSFWSKVITGSDGLPIGVGFQRHDHFPKSSPEPLGPWPCSFQGVGWVLSDAFGYSARFVLGPDGGLVGISFRVWNNSLNTPLVLIRKPDALPFSCTIAQTDGADIRLRNLGGFIDLDRAKEMEEWPLPPRAHAYFFVPIRDILPHGFSPAKGVGYFLEVSPNVLPKGTVRRLHGIYPSFNSLWATITEFSLSIDPHAALKEAQVTMEKDL